MSRRPSADGGDGWRGADMDERRLGEFFPQGTRYLRRDKGIDLTAEAGDFFDDAGAQVGQFFFGGQKTGFQIGMKFAIHEGHLEFELEV